MPIASLPALSQMQQVAGCFNFKRFALLTLFHGNFIAASHQFWQDWNIRFK